MIKVYSYKPHMMWLLCMLFAGHVSGQHKVEKTLTYTFGMESGGTFVIDNKYGDVQIEGWDESKLSVEMSVTVHHKDKDKAYNLLDRIEATVLEGENFVNITSTIRSKSSSFLDDLLRDFTKKLDISKTNIDINYIIKLPSELKVDVVNTFGDVFIDNCIGYLNANVSHGALRINSLLTSADIKLKFGELHARDLPDAELIMKNSEAYITNGENLIVESNSSVLEIESLKELQIIGARDKIQIKKLNVLSGNVKYTSIQLTELGKSMDLTMQLGDLRCDMIDGQESKIRIEQRSSDVDINIANAAFVLEATMQGGSFRLPESAQNISQEFVDEEKNHRTIRASFGNVTVGTMIIRGVKGDVVLRDF